MQSVNDMEELEEERALMAQPEESSRPINPTRGTHIMFYVCVVVGVVY